MIDRVLMVTRKMMIQMDDTKKMLKEVYNELALNDIYAVEVKKLDDVLRSLQDLHNQLDDLEHVVLAEGIR